MRFREIGAVGDPAIGEIEKEIRSRLANPSGSVECFEQHVALSIDDAKQLRS